MSRSPKSPSLFGLAEELAKKKCFFILQLHLFFFINFSFFFFSSSTFLSPEPERKVAKESGSFTYGDCPLLPGDGNHRLRRLWRRNSQVRRCSFYFVGWFEVPLSIFALEGYRAQTPCDLYSLLLVISYHPPASCWGRSVFYWVGAFYWGFGFRYGVAGLDLVMFLPPYSNRRSASSKRSHRGGWLSPLLPSLS